MDRALYLNRFQNDEIPHYSCPHCLKGVLKLQGTFDSHETEASKAQHEEDWWDPHMVEMVFNCSLICGVCNELVIMVGRGELDIVGDLDEEGMPITDWEDFYNPKFFYPPLKIINCPPRTPDTVKSHINVASSLFFASPSACANSLRSAAELILTDLGISKTNSRGGFISFCERIKKLGDDRQDVKDLFDAIRWLGNYGSHGEDNFDARFVLDAFEIMDHLLNETYSDHKLKIKNLVAGIIKNEGPYS